MIPKIIYYAWFGKGKKSELEEKCIASWKQHCPDYRIVEINETNFDIENWPYLNEDKKRYIKEAYAKKNFSFVADVARMEWLRFNNGFMFDADIEFLKSVDEMRNNNAFIGECHQGFYENGCVGISNGLPNVLLETYKKLTFGKAMYVLVNEEVYKTLNPHGQTYLKTNECSLYGMGYIGNSLERFGHTILVHHDENTWTKKDTLGFKIKSDLLRCKIFINQQRSRENEIKIYGEPQDFADLSIFSNEEVTIPIICNSNYFLNNKVFKLIGNGYTISRNYIVSKFEEITLNNGNRLRYDSGN